MNTFGFGMNFASNFPAPLASSVEISSKHARPRLQGTHIRVHTTYPNNPFETSRGPLILQLEYRNVSNERSKHDRILGELSRLPDSVESLKVDHVSKEVLLCNHGLP